MDNNEYIEFSGKSLENVLTEACRHFDVSSAEGLDYSIIDMGSAGFLGLNRKPTIIKARRAFKAEEIRKNEVEAPSIDIDKAAPQASDAEEVEEKISESHVPSRTEQAAAIEKEADYTTSEGELDDLETLDTLDDSDSPEIEREKEDPEVVTGRVKAFLDDLFKSMDMVVEVKTKFNEERYSMSIELVGDDMGILIGKRGITLDSLQYLVSLVANKGNGAYVRVKVDTENYRSRRQKTLENLARNISYKVKRSKRPVSLEPMNPYERRIIHYALQGDRFVTTHSEGDEPYRRVVVTPKRYNGGSRDRDRDRDRNRFD
ncbi:MAG: protein jag [Lachnospiraceae bacterium]|nr:protein jag [Lachnospiraceae bacterium]